MATFFVQSGLRNKIEALEIEVTLSENHEFTNVITSYPVDIGFNISDHIQQQSPRLTLNGLTSNTPVKLFSGQIGKLVRSDLTDRIQETFKVLLNYAGFQIPKQPTSDSIQIIVPKLLTIVTGYMVYRNMAVQKVNFPREKTSGNSINYSLDFIQIRKVSSKYSFVDNTDSLGGKAANVKTQAAETANTGKNVLTNTTDESLSYKGLQYLKGLIK